MSKTNKPYVYVMTAEYAPEIIGGLGTVASELTRTLSNAMVKVVVITTSKSKSTHVIRNKKVTILRIPAKGQYINATKSFKPALIQQLTRRYFTAKPNIIHVHSLEFAQASIFLKRKYHIPVIYTCHSLVAMEQGSRIGRNKNQDLLMRQADRIVVPSYWLKREIQKRYSGLASKIVVIPNGVRPVAHGTTAPKHKLLFVGRLVRSKGIEPLLNAIPFLSFKNRKVSLAIIGNGSLKYRNHLKSIARSKGVRSQIKWLGTLPHNKVQHLYSSYGAVVVPSKQESFCLVALEALANGIPLVSSRAGGLREFVNQGNAQIITAVNSKAIGHAITGMWNNPAKTRQRVVVGMQLGRKNTWKRVANQYRSLFNIVYKQQRK